MFGKGKFNKKKKVSFNLEPQFKSPTPPRHGITNQQVDISNFSENEISVGNEAIDKGINEANYNNENSPQSSEELTSNVEILTFPYSEAGFIPKLDVSGVDLPSLSKNNSPRRKKRIIKVPEVPVRSPRRVQSFKEPTESVKHAILRSMSHREPNAAARNFLDKCLAMRPPSFGYQLHGNEMSTTPRSSKSSVASNIPENNTTDVRIKCGYCLRKNRIIPAAGYCKYCSEYLCAQCVSYHGGRLTRIHPIIVFYCQQCKEMNILNNKGAGHCVRCKQFYCCACVIDHCSKTGHTILEGDDMQDVVDYMIHMK